MPFDLNALMQQAQALQEQMQKAQERLAQKTVTGSSGGGMVLVTANGKGEIQKVQIDKQAVDPRDVPMLEDLILAAVNSVKADGKVTLSDAAVEDVIALLPPVPKGEECLDKARVANEADALKD